MSVEVVAHVKAVLFVTVVISVETEVCSAVVTYIEGLVRVMMSVLVGVRSHTSVPIIIIIHNLYKKLH